MNQIKSILSITAIALTLTFGTIGCETIRDNPGAATGAAIGAGTGAVLGGVVGSQSGDTATGAVIGGVTGAGVGGVIGHQHDKQEEQDRRIDRLERRY
ncbi:MAG TPA: glycine zipper domain-containing protein [Candidatus Sumerlaeota bacterium]|nr:MAG: putative outer membrane lipoprotein [candidate division BRC1 bacterium ADurb.BinA292]HOE95167.1 glycine zipper domain-containing protein [Candidatus Sumerlaeota bacterium]HOR29671.1 glycine zipper domain-containing protein [Candidatus Sumerlaeota bacterium]HPK03710.1 glycine zipper domain-containing protein [Candidatus Sumerlaeota bacterium]